MSSFTTADLDRRQLREPLDLVRHVPNLVGHNNSGVGNSNAYFLRGLGNTETIATFDPPVGTYMDEVYISRQSANNYPLFDIDRIDVLRGPQGTLSGRNTTGGAINIVTRKPAPEFGADVELGVGSFARHAVRGTVNYPVSDRWLTRASAYFEEADGNVRSTVTGEENNDLEAYGMRFAVRFLPSERTTWDFVIENLYHDELNLIRNCRPSPGGITPATDCAHGVDADRNASAFTASNGAGGRLDQALRGEGLDSYNHSVRLYSTLGMRVGEVDLTFITGRIDESWDYVVDFAPTGVAGGQSQFAIAQEQDTYQWSQEITATGAIADDRLHYTAGLFYLDEKNETDFQDISVNHTPVYGPVGATWLQIDRQMVNTTDSIAAYVQADYSFDDAWTVTVGGRYTEDDKGIEYRSRTARSPNEVEIFDISTAELEAGGVPVELDDAEFTPMLGIKYEPSDDWQIYASATQGFKSGGWNARGSASAPCFHTPLCYQPFGAETVWSYEGGFKSEFHDRHMRLNATLFWTEVDDLQLISGVAGSAGVVFQIQNAGDARYRGAELELDWVPSEALTLYAGLGLMDAEYTSIRQESPLTTHTQPVRAPDATGYLGASYTIPLASLHGRMTVGGDAAFTGNHWVSAAQRAGRLRGRQPLAGPGTGGVRIGRRRLVRKPLVQELR